MERKGIKQQSSLVLDRTLDCGFGLTDLAKGAFGADSNLKLAASPVGCDAPGLDRVLIFLVLTRPRLGAP